jgi:hypothetical protein
MASAGQLLTQALKASSACFYLSGGVIQKKIVYFIAPAAARQELPGSTAFTGLPIRRMTRPVRNLILHN